MDSQTVDKLIADNRLDEALHILNNTLAQSPGDAEALFARGRIYWRQGHHGEAISDYTAAVSIDPQSPASIALEQARQVMDFFNPDLLNP